MWSKLTFLLLGALFVWLWSHRSSTDGDRLPGKPTSTALDVLRIVLTFLVVSNHVRLKVLEPSDDLSAAPLIAATHLATGYGEGAVLVFFVLSGYLITWRYTEALATRRLSLRAFAERRAIRLYIVLVPALLLTSVTAWVTGSAVRGGELLGNLAFLQPKYVAPFGGNEPLWSLGFEGQCYVGFFAVVLVLRRGATRAARILGLFLLIALLSAFPYFATYASLWLLGAFVALRAPPKNPSAGGALTNRRWLGLLGLCVCCLLGAMTTLRLLPAERPAVLDYIHYAAIGVSAGMTIALLISGERAPTPAYTKERPWQKKLVAALSGSSYSSYVTHFPLLLLYCHWFRPAPRAAHWSTLPEVCLVTLALIGCGWLFAQICEVHTSRVRRAFDNWSSGRFLVAGSK